MCPQELNSDDEVLAVKILAEYSDLNEYVYIVFFIDKYNNNLVDIAFIISNDYKMLNFLNAYTDLVELYKHIKIYNKLNENNSIAYYNKFNDVLLNILSEDKNINNIIIYSSGNNKISTIDIFSGSINKFMDFHIGTFDIDTKTIDISTLNSAVEDINKEVENSKSVNMAYGNKDGQYEYGEEALENQVPAYKLINASFVVDPISGKSINDIVPGDKVIVSINSNTVEENIIYLELNGKKDKYSRYLVPAEVLEKHVEDKLIKILLKLIEGYCCLIEEIEPIKLKLFNVPNKDIPADSDAEKNDNAEKSLFEKTFAKINTFKLIMFGLGAIIIFLFIAIIYVFFIQV